MSSPADGAQPYSGRTRPGGVGWTRIGITAGVGVVLLVLLWVRPITAGDGPALPIAAFLAFALMAAWTWMRLWTSFVVDERGVTVSFGGIWTQQSWPLETFRLVQLRDIPAGTFGVTVGGVGWRKGKVFSGEPKDRRPVAGGRIFTTGEVQNTYRALVTKPGTMVEIIARSEPHYLISPEDPEATAQAIATWIRQR